MYSCIPRLPSTSLDFRASGNEILSFDIYEPKKYVSLSADGSGMEEIPLTVSIWDSNRFADDLLGEVTLSILDFMEMEDSDHYGVLNSNRSVDWWPLTFATKNGVIPAGEVRLQVGWRKRRRNREEREGNRGLLECCMH